MATGAAAVISTAAACPEVCGPPRVVRGGGASVTRFVGPGPGSFYRFHLLSVVFLSFCRFSVLIFVGPWVWVVRSRGLGAAAFNPGVWGRELPK